MKIVNLWALAALLLGLVAPPALAQTGDSRFEKVTCDTFDLGLYAGNAQEGRDVECGYLSVPERHAQPAGKTIQLAVLIIKSTSSHPASDPLLLAQGGPGGSGIELFASLAQPDNETGQLLRAHRDLIVFEQRGTRYSRPFLNCPEVIDDLLKTLEQRLNADEEDESSRQAYAACQKRFKRQGVDLSVYNSFENADDIATLAQVLGYQQLNFYGVSYGTMLGQHLMRRHPEILRAVILDAISPLQVNFYQDVAFNMNRSFSELFKACAADPECNRAYPDLEQVFFETVDRLNQQSARISVTDFDGRQTYNAYFGGDDLLDITFQLLYASEAIPLLPYFIYQARAGQFDLPLVVMPLLLHSERTQAAGLYMTVMCAEDADFTADQFNLTGVRPPVADAEKAGVESFLQTCADWQLPPLGPAADEPVKSDIPTLLLSGYFDPITPPVNGGTLAQNLPRAYNYVFPANGHGAFLSGTCSSQIIRDFLNKPAQAPNSACVSDPPAPVFLTPANTLMSPGATYVMNLVTQIALNFFDPKKLIIALLPLARDTLLVVGLLAFPPVWLLGWLVNWLRHRPADKRGLARLAPWLVVLMLALIVTFLTLQIYSFVALALDKDIFGVVFGLSRSYAWIFVLPWLIALISGVMAALALRSWVKGYWGVLARLYYSFTALLALGYTLVLVFTGMLGVLW